MASENETFENIVKEMRQAEATWHRSEIAQLPTQYLKEWSDRIEAAAKREVAELEREVAELRECLKETMVIASAEYHHHSCFKHVKCGEIERCKTCKVIRWRKALQDEGGAK